MMNPEKTNLLSEEYEEAYAAAWLDRFETEKAANYQAVKRAAGIPSPRKGLPWLRMALIAAALVLAAVSGALIQRTRPRPQTAGAAPTCISVPEGSRMSVRLPDGTEVWLNSGSRLTYDGAFRTREVALEGEGMFKVARDEARPFVARTADMDVAVLGTVFNLRSYPGGHFSEVSLIDGKVSVTGRASGLCKTLSPDQKAVVDRNTGIITVEEVDAARVAHWTSGKLHFTDSSLSSLLEDIERMKGVSFSCDSRLLEGELFSGTIRLDQSVDAILRNLDLDRKLVWRQQGDIIEISEKQRR